MKLIIINVLIIFISIAANSETQSVTDCNGNVINVNLEDESTADILKNIDKECYLKYERQKKLISEFELLFGKVNSTEQVFEPLIKFRNQIEKEILNLSDLVNKIYKADIENSSAVDINKLDTDLSLIDLKFTEFKNNWSFAHKNSISDSAKKFIALKFENDLPQELKEKILEFEKNLPDYVQQSGTVSSIEIDEIIRIVQNTKLIFSSIKYQWIEVQFKKWTNSIASGLKAEIISLQNKNMVNQIENQLDIENLLNKEQKYAYFGVTETSILRMQEGVSKIDALLSSNITLNNEVVNILTDKKNKLINSVSRIKVLDKNSNIKLLLASCSVILKSFIEKDIRNESLKQRVLDTKEKIVILMSIVEKNKSNFDIAKSSVLLLEQNYRQLSEIKNVLFSGGVK